LTAAKRGQLGLQRHRQRREADAAGQDVVAFGGLDVAGPLRLRAGADLFLVSAFLARRERGNLKCNWARFSGEGSNLRANPDADLHGAHERLPSLHGS